MVITNFLLNKLKTINERECVKDAWKPDIMQRRYLLLESAGDTFFAECFATLSLSSPCYQRIFFFNLSTQTFCEVYRNVFSEDSQQSQEDS